MIRSQEVEAHFEAPARRDRTTPAARQLLHGSLFLAILISPLVFIEPSPYEAATAILALICVLAGVGFDRKILPLALLLIAFNIGGAMALTPVADDSMAVSYTFISIYMGITAIMFACLFAQDSLRRIAIMRRAYLLAALIASLIGIAGYFGYAPDAELYGRARSTFKDPNVFGPFLILPMLFLVQSILARGPRLRYLAFLGVSAFALLLSFSRGAWIHFALSAAIMLALMFLTAPNMRTRARLMLLSTVSAAALLGLFAVALSFGTISETFNERAKLAQSYDVGSGGRFGLQEMAVGAALDNVNGMGPHEFDRVYGGQQHNVYLQSFLVYGWIGGFSYVALVILTLLIGFRFAFVATPWQPYLIAALAAFCGEVVEGFVIDTDHWRHFFLLLGIIWGLAVATINAISRRGYLARPASP